MDMRLLSLAFAILTFENIDSLVSAQLLRRIARRSQENGDGDALII
jgi:hypothetical protein